MTSISMQQQQQCHQLLKSPSSSAHVEGIVAVGSSSNVEAFDNTQKFEESQTQTQTQTQHQYQQDNDEYGFVVPLDKLSEHSSQVEVRGSNRCKIGRVKNSDIQISSGIVSSKHCTVYMEDGLFYIIDHKSSNGTYINRKLQRLDAETPYQLKHGDIIYIALPHVSYQKQFSKNDTTPKPLNHNVPNPNKNVHIKKS